MRILVPASGLVLLLVIAGILLYLGKEHLVHRQALAKQLVLPFWPYGHFSVALLILSELLLATLTALGAYMQYAMIVLALLSIKMIVLRNRFDHPSIPSRLFYLLLLACCLSRFITGAGALAIDLPV